MMTTTAAPRTADFDRSLYLACGRSIPLYAARRAGFETVEAHRASIRAAGAQREEAERAERAAAREARRAANPERPTNICISPIMGAELGIHAFEVSERDVLDMFDADDLRGDTLYRRGVDGRVTRVLW